MSLLKYRRGLEEIDSYLYQTVGQDAIEFVAQALEVPLFRQTIKGKPIQLETEYGQRRESGSESVTEGDETEDLFELLQTVKVGHVLSLHE